MGTWADFFQNMDWVGLLFFLFTVAASLLCITLHELSHGFVAYRLGDPTAKQAGRLTFNPLKHIDLLGLLMMLMVHVGWAKPVPIDLRQFKHPKRDMAFTALAGPAMNFLLSYLALLFGHAIYRWSPNTTVTWYILLALMYIAVLSLGLGMFNLIPISPLDGSKILLSFLPNKVCITILRYERFLAIGMVLLALFGAFDGILHFMIGHVMEGLCFLSGFPCELITILML